MSGSSGKSYTVAINWIRVGIATHGIDVGHLLASPMLWMEISPGEAMVFRDPLFDAYMVGISECGWSENEKLVRLTFLTRLLCEAIRQICLITHSIDDADFRQMEENLMRRPLMEISARYAEFMDFHLDCMDEAQRLAAQL